MQMPFRKAVHEGGTMTLLASGIIRVKETGLGLAGAEVQLVTSHGSKEVVLCTSASRSDGCFDLCAEGRAAEQASRSRTSLDVRVLDASHQIGRAHV